MIDQKDANPDLKVTQEKASRGFEYQAPVKDV